MFDDYLFEFVKRLEAVLISVDYRLAPQFPYPNGLNDCYSVVLHVLENSVKLGVDLEKFILIGDSAGATFAIAITQKLLEENLKQPKIQVIINPLVQAVLNRLPSRIQNKDRSLFDQIGFYYVDLIFWYTGIHESNDEFSDIVELLENNQVLGLIDKKLATKYLSYMDINKIPDKYKIEKSYYDNYDLEKIKGLILDKSEVNIKSNKTINKLLYLLNANISSLFVDFEKLVGLPKAYFIIFEWDVLKDEGLLYAQRLKEANVDVNIAFYEKGFHGMLPCIQKSFGFDEAIQIQNELIDYLKLNL